MNNTITLIHIGGTVTSAPTLTHDGLVEFVLADDNRREYIVRLPRTELGPDITPGTRVRAAGTEGWVVPGRVWRHEPSRTIVEAHDVQLDALAFAA